MLSTAIIPMYSDLASSTSNCHSSCMLATNFTRNNEVSFSVNNQKQISNQQNKDQLMILYLKKDKIFYEDKIIKLKDLENKYFNDWNAQNFDKIVPNSMFIF